MRKIKLELEFATEVILNITDEEFEDLQNGGISDLEELAFNHSVYSYISLGRGEQTGISFRELLEQTKC